jgi:DNA-binding NarL/FixJ family response regulator
MPPRDPTDTADTGATRVLLVDDHALVRQGMAAIINEQPDMHVCGEADGVRSAIAAVADTKPDVALVDLSIKDGDGLELLRDIRTRFPDVRTLVISMYDEAVYAERALRAGAKAYIMKAEAAKTVIAAIRLVLRGETYLSPRMLSQLADLERRGSAVAKGGAERLSDRELQVLRCVGRGMSTREIADELFISIKTVEAHREHIKEKLGLASAGDLLRYAIEHNRVYG